ncbi:MAG: MBL fold metallo-hydrolase [Endomicrobia bacterium]|nr:MBL fold metallo-hydrolase [Endomicrobiia bacterium]
MNNQIFSFVVNEFATNCYIYKDLASQNSIIIDPGGETKQIVDFIEKNKLKIEKIVLTHSHYDHIKGLEQITRFFPVEVIIYEDEYPQVIDNEKNLSIFLGEECIKNPQNIKWQKVKDKEIFYCGSKKIKIIHTPGHTIGSMCLYIEENNTLFSGDTLFCGSIGRTDFPTGDIDMLENSLKKIFSLPEDTIFFPGHNNPCILKKEKKHNPFVKL